MGLTGEDLGHLQEKILEVFDQNELTQLLQVKMDIQFEHVAGKGTLPERVFNALRSLERNGDLLDFLYATRTERRKKREFKQVVDALMGKLLAPEPKFEPAPGASPRPHDANDLLTLRELERRCRDILIPRFDGYEVADREMVEFASAVVVAGDRARWARLVRLATEAGKPVRYYEG